MWSLTAGLTLSKVKFLFWINLSELKIDKMLQLDLSGLAESKLPWEWNFPIHVSVCLLPKELLVYKVSMVSAVY